jgi:hypothetical protein
MTLFGKRRQPESDADRERVRGWLLPWINGDRSDGPDPLREAVHFRFFDRGLRAALERHASCLTERELRRGWARVKRAERSGFEKA